MIIQHCHIRWLKLSANTNIKSKITIVSLICLLITVNNFAQKKSTDNNVWLVTTIKYLEKNINIANERITRYENEIVKCDKTIATSEKLINLALEKGNSEAEKVARDALAKSNSAKYKNVKLLDSAINLKRQSELILASVKKELSINSSSNKIEALTLNYSGNISIQKSNGEQYTLNDSRGSLLESGDIISTSADSRIELQFLEGRGNVTLGENSKLKFKKQDSTDVIDLIRGKVKLGVQKIDEYEKDLMEQYEKYKQTVTSIPESYEQFIKTIRAKVQKKLEVRYRGGTCSVRGTQFIVNANDDNNTEIIVFEGTVEMKSTISLKTILINAGQKGIVNDKGILSEPTEIDVTRLEKWWEDE